MSVIQSSEKKQKQNQWKRKNKIFSSTFSRIVTLQDDRCALWSKREYVELVDKSSESNAKRFSKEKTKWNKQKTKREKILLQVPWWESISFDLWVDWSMKQCVQPVHHWKILVIDKEFPIFSLDHSFPKWNFVKVFFSLSLSVCQTKLTWTIARVNKWNCSSLIGIW